MPDDPTTARRARSFDGVAEAYDRYRPAYPRELVDDVLLFAGATVTGGVLDVGAGTGKATLALARAGLTVTALEPAVNMADVLRRRAEAEGLGARVTVRAGTFEDLSAEDGPFGLVVAAQSFHWAYPDTRWRRLVDLLAPDGVAAMFWNSWAIDPAAHDVAELRAIYDEPGAGLVPDLGRDDPDDWPLSEIEQTSGLADVQERFYPWGLDLATEDYLSLLGTTSQYAVLPDEARDRLFARLRHALGTRVALDAGTQLYLMRRTR